MYSIILSFFVAPAFGVVDYSRHDANAQLNLVLERMPHQAQSSNRTLARMVDSQGRIVKSQSTPKLLRDDQSFQLGALLQVAKQVMQREFSNSSTTTYNDDCPCIGFANVPGTAEVSLSGSTVEYPLELGGECKAWDDDTHPSCKEGGDPGKGNDWCAQEWCYVDPCNCAIAVEPKTSSYMPNAKYQNKGLYYSYATCGGTDTWTDTEHKEACVNQKTKADCDAKSDKCGWTGTKCLGKDLVGTCESNDISLASMGKSDCLCVGIDGREGVMECKTGDTLSNYSAATGGSCQAWDANTHPDCKVASPPSWCQDSWCYVDPCNCGLDKPPTTSSYVPDGKYLGRLIYYSYATCGSSDSWTDSNHDTACKNQETEAACTSLLKDDKTAKCGWTGSKCLGKELVETCSTGPGSVQSSTHSQSVFSAIVGTIFFLTMH